MHTRRSQQSGWEAVQSGTGTDPQQTLNQYSPTANSVHPSRSPQDQHDRLLLLAVKNSGGSLEMELTISSTFYLVLCTATSHAQACPHPLRSDHHHRDRSSSTSTSTFGPPTKLHSTVLNPQQCRPRSHHRSLTSFVHHLARILARPTVAPP